MHIGFIHNRRAKKNAPTGDVCRGKVSDDTFWGRAKMSVCVSYVSAVRTSVTGITFCAVKVGLLISCQMDCRGRGRFLTWASCPAQLCLKQRPRAI